MATAEELLNSVLKNEASVLSATDAVFVIDGESRTINVPDSERLFGVEGDKDVERKYFQCPKIVGDNIDLSQHQIYVSYAFTTTENSTSFPDADGLYHCEDVEVSGDNITFSWLLSGNVFANPGFIAFKVMAKKSEGEELKTKWNTAPAIGSVLLTVPDGENIAEEYPDVINQILDRLDAIEESGSSGYVLPVMTETKLGGGKAVEKTDEDVPVAVDPSTGQLFVPTYPENTGGGGGTVDPEQIKQAVNEYLEENPVSGMTATVKNAFLECFANVAWATAEGQACYDKLKTALNESVGEIKLSSITATCSETAQIGTAASDLDIVVTAIYSDGSSAQVTGWTTSGTVVEGTNTFVVSYGGKNTTVTVTGVDLYYVLNKASNKSEIMSSNSYSDGGETGAGFPGVYLAWHLWGSKVVEQDTAVKIKYIPSETNYNGVFAYCINPETFTIDRKKYYAVQLTAHTLVDTSYEWEYTIKAGYAFGISLGSNSPVPTVEVVS